MSYIGSPSANIGTDIAKAAADFIAPCIDMAPNKNPKSCAPVSPINIDAG